MEILMIIYKTVIYGQMMNEEPKNWTAASYQVLGPSQQIQPSDPTHPSGHRLIATVTIQRE